MIVEKCRKVSGVNAVKHRLFTFLGTGNYQPGVYSLEGQEQETPFVQVALCKFLQPDEMVAFVTAEAKEKKWPELEESLRKEFDSLDYKFVEIPCGKDENEVWQIFDHFANEVEDRETLSIDITHSFRSLPIISLACVQYLRALKDISLKGIYYGAWEARENKGEIPLVPTFDLTPFVELMDWSEAVGVFDRSGDMTRLKSLFEAEVVPRQKISKGSDREARLLKEVGKGLYELSQRMATCRGKLIYTDPLLDKISEKLDELEHDFDPPKAFRPLLSKIRDKIEDVKPPKIGLSQEVSRGLEAVKWCIQHDLIQQAYTLLQETLITHFCQATNKDIWERRDRQEVGRALGLYYTERANWDSSAVSNSAFIEDVWDLAGKEMCDLYSKLTVRRNDINHAGIVEMANEHKIVKEIEQYLTSALSLLEQ